YGVKEPLLLGGWGRLEDGPRLAVERHDANRVSFIELLHEELQGILHELEAVFPPHGAGGVGDEDERASLTLFAGDLAPLEAHLEGRVPRLVGKRARGHFGVNCEGLPFLAGRRVAALEVVDEL